MKPIKNSEFFYELKTGAETWSDIGGAFHTVTESLNEAVINEKSTDGANMQSYVMGNCPEFCFEGVYICDDPVISFLFKSEVYFGIMRARKTKLRIMTPDDRILECDVNIAEIKKKGGESNQKCSVFIRLKADGTVMALG